MPRRKWIDKHNPNTKTFHLLYRSQDDPLLNDENAGERALFEVNQRAETSESSLLSKRGFHIADLEDGLDFESMRENEGEAAEHGIYFDDTSYDYMQHLRDLGETEGDAHWIDAVPTKVNGKNKSHTMRLEDALRQVSLEEADSITPSLVDDGLSAFTRSTKQRGIELQQDIPDEIAGFQPDMDPRLREVLEALDDDAYVDEKDGDNIFEELGLDGKNNGELDIDEFETNYIDDDDDDGWGSDTTEKAPEQLEISVPTEKILGQTEHEVSRVETLDGDAAAIAVAEDGDWLKDFAKYKTDVAKKIPAAQAASVVAASAVQDRPPSLYTLNGTPLRQKKRKGALTNPSSYSMTSSSLNRGGGLQLLDARFEQVEKLYDLDEGDEMNDMDDMDGGVSMISGMTGASKASKFSTMSTSSFADPSAVRQDFEGMMDSFLGDWEKAHPGGGKKRGAKGKRGKNGNEAFGLQQLDKVRQDLGPARVSHRAQKA